MGEGVEGEQYYDPNEQGKAKPMGCKQPFLLMKSLRDGSGL